MNCLGECGYSGDCLVALHQGGELQISDPIEGCVAVRAGMMVIC